MNITKTSEEDILNIENVDESLGCRSTAPNPAGSLQRSWHYRGWRGGGLADLTHTHAGLV